MVPRAEMWQQQKRCAESSMHAQSKDMMVVVLRAKENQVRVVYREISSCLGTEKEVRVVCTVKEVRAVLKDTLVLFAKTSLCCVQRQARAVC